MWGQCYGEQPFTLKSPRNDSHKFEYRECLNITILLRDSIDSEDSQDRRKACNFRYNFCLVRASHGQVLTFTNNFPLNGLNHCSLSNNKHSLLNTWSKHFPLFLYRGHRCPCPLTYYWHFLHVLMANFYNLEEFFCMANPHMNRDSSRRVGSMYKKAEK